MADPKSVAPYACLPILEDILPADPTAPPAFMLPSSFPAELFTEEQMDAVAAWFDTWAADILHAIRCALLDHPHAPGQRQGVSAPTLDQLTRHATILAHLLRLHPAADAPVDTLASQLGVSRRALYYTRDTVLRYIRPALAGTISRTSAAASFFEQLATVRHLDTAQATQLDARTILVPFAPHTLVCARFAAVQHIAAIPAVAGVHEDLTPTGQNAVHITLK